MCFLAASVCTLLRRVKCLEGEIVVLKSLTSANVNDEDVHDADVDVAMTANNMSPLVLLPKDVDLVDTLVEDTLVDAVENAEVAEIKPAVFRGLTRCSATIKEFDTIARPETIKELAPEDDLAQEVTHDLEMKFNKIEDEFPEDIDDEFSNADGEVADTQDIFYVCKRTLESMQEKLKKSEDITEEDVTDLMSMAQLADEEIMVPVDMRDHVDQMIENLFSGMLGPKGTAEAFVKAHECFKANKDNEPEDERPAPMTAAEWRKILDEQDEGDDGEFGLMEAAEEEDVCDDDAEEDDEPASKKAKTDG
jgi:hypothetical protein